jgi:hypothetical protein
VPNAERDRVIHCLEALLEADQDLRRRIRANEVLIRQSIREMKKGSTVAATMASANAGFGRESVNEALDVLTRARHQLRLAVTAAGLSEGMSIGDLGRAWGISRQLASRFAKEAREGP